MLKVKEFELAVAEGSVEVCEIAYIVEQKRNDVLQAWFDLKHRPVWSLLLDKSGLLEPDFADTACSLHLGMEVIYNSLYSVVGVFDEEVLDFVDGFKELMLDVGSWHEHVRAR